MDSETMLTRRESKLRSVAAICLTGIAVVQAIDLPSLLAQGGVFGGLALIAMALCVALGIALAAAPAGSRRLWGVVAMAAALLLAGWAVPRAVAVPGLSHHLGHWLALPGAVPGALAAVCLVLAGVAVRPTRAQVRGLAAAVAVLLALAPGAAVLIVALGPGLAGGETSLAAGVHVHAHGGLDESLIQFQAIPGGHGGRYVYSAPATPHQTALGVALIIAAALVFTYGAVGYLRRRTALCAHMTLLSVERGMGCTACAIS